MGIGRSREDGATSLAGILMMFIGMCAIGLAVFGVTAAGATQPNPEHKITLCHRTDSYTNPYVAESVDVASTHFEGHDGHNGPVFYAAIPQQEKWGDIIPAFDFGPGEQYAGKNLTAEGLAILDNGCNLPGATTTTSATTTTTTTQPEETTTTQPEETTTTTTQPEETTTTTPVTQVGGTTTSGEEPVTIGSLGTPQNPNPPGGSNGPAGSGILPFTGSPIVFLLGTGAAFLASGIGLIVRRRQWAR
jgi:hypothetical protein